MSAGNNTVKTDTTAGSAKVVDINALSAINIP
jgi:hypothetical protein